MSVVVVSFQRRQRLADTLKETLVTARDALEIVVVDDGSTDGTAEMLERLAGTDARLRPVTIPNGGAEGARLAGARAARGEVVLHVDDDVVLAPGAVVGHARHHAAAERLVVAGHMPVNAGAPASDSYPRDIYARAYDRHVEAWEEHPESVLTSFWGGHVSLKREDHLALEPALGGGFRGYHEDLDWGVCCLEACLRGVFDRRLEARHHYARSPSAFLKDARSSGIGLAKAHARHPDVLVAPDVRRLTRGLPAPAAWLVGRSAQRRWPRRLVGTLVRVLGAVRLFRVQRFAASLMWRIEQLRAVDELAAAVPEPTPVLVTGGPSR